MKIKALIASLSLAAGVGNANAAIVPGELFLSVWDQTAQQSYSQDLGVDVSRFLSDNSYAYYSGANWSVPLNLGVWSGFYNPANAGKTVYNVAAARLVGLNELAQDYGYLSSLKTTNPDPVASGQVASVQVPAGVIGEKATIYNGGTNQEPNAANIWPANIPDSTPPVPNPGYYNFAWGDRFNSTVPASQSNQGQFDELTKVIFHGLAPQYGQDELGEPLVLDRFVTLPGQFRLTDNALSYVVSGTTPIPVPAAVWLFGSALAAVAGFARRGNRA